MQHTHTYIIKNNIVLSTEKMHNVKVENYVLFNGLTEDLGPGYSFSDHSEEVFQRGKERARIYRS